MPRAVLTSNDCKAVCSGSIPVVASVRTASSEAASSLSRPLP